MTNIIQNLINSAKQNRKTIVLAEGFEPRVLQATHQILEENIANIILLGNEQEIKTNSVGLDIEKAQIIDPNNYKEINTLTEQLYENRKHKGLTYEQASELIKQPLYFGTMLVHSNLADGMVAGSSYTTADTLRPALQIIKTVPGKKLVSSFFIMVIPDSTLGENGTFIFSDCGLNHNPTAEELAEIAIDSASSFKQLIGTEPKVALLSYSTYGSGSGESADKVRLATQLLKNIQPTFLFDGELQVDAAINPLNYNRKAPGSPIEGKANILIFPNLNSGNIGYKLVQILAKAQAIGPIIQGLAKPVNDLSRNCSAEDIVSVVAITCLQSAI